MPGKFLPTLARQHAVQNGAQAMQVQHVGRGVPLLLGD